MYIKNVKKYSRATATIARCGIKFFIEWTLGRQWTLFELVRPPREKKLPTILSVEEVRKILKLEDGKVTFKYKESATDQIRFSTVTAEEFIRRFLQHVLPQRFVKVRYYGLMSPANRHLLKRAREVLGARATAVSTNNNDPRHKQREALRCPNCASVLTLVERLCAKAREPP